MPAASRDRVEARAVAIGIALVATIVVALGTVIVNAGTAAPPAGIATTASPTPTPVPAIKPAASIHPVQRLTGDSATFDGSTGHWTGTDASLSTVATPVHAGKGALEIDGTSTLGGEMSAWSPPVTARSSDRYVATAYVRALTAVRGVQGELRFLDKNGSILATINGQPNVDSLASWTELYPAVGISPKGTTQVQLGIVLPVVGAGAMHVVDDASIAQTPGGSTSVVGPLYAHGAQILQGNGQPLIMRGIQRFGLEGGTQTPMPSNAEIGQLKLWGANEVRISLGEQKWLNTSCHFVPDYPQQVDKVVHWVTSRGMVAMINLHFASIGPCGKAGLTPMADAPGSITFWQEVAARYQNNPLVAFDLFNEPHVPADVWLDGGTFEDNGLQVPAAGMQALYNVVRGTGATNLIIISGLDYADHPPVDPVQGYNIAYGAHAYQCEAAPPPSCTTKNPYDAAVPLSHWVTFAKTHPVIVTEFGWPAVDDGRYNASVVAYAQSHGWGWSAFAFDGSTGGLFDLIDGGRSLSDLPYEPNNSAMPLVAGLALDTVAHAARKKK